MKASKSEMTSEFKVQIAKQVQHVMPEMHYHDFYEIYIQDQGTRDHLVSNSLYSLAPGDVMLLKPNILHQSISNVSHTRSLVYFTEKFIQQYFSPEMCKRFLSVFSYNCISLSTENYYKISGIIRDMGKENSEGSDSLIFIHLGELFMTLLANIRQHPPAQLTKPSDSASSISPLLSYIHENYLTLDKISDIAATFYITPSHLCRTFKRLTGHTITQYINILKIQQACNLLKETDKSITEIALDCGYNSTMYFCKTFKMVLNITPTEYRKI